MNKEIEALLQRQKELNAIRGPQKEALGKNLSEGLRIDKELEQQMSRDRRAGLWKLRQKIKEERIQLEIALSKTSSETDEVRDALHWRYKADRAESFENVPKQASANQLATDIRNLRDEFKEFSLDFMRVRSARKMASEFFERLDEILNMNKEGK